MCGRFASFRDAQDLADAFEVAPPDVSDDARLLPPSWNIAPTDPVRIVAEREEDGEIRRTLRVARWGLVPPWAKDPSVGSRMINARAETLVDKPAFRRAAAARRCLVPAEGYYEWQARTATGRSDDPAKRRPTKQPFWIHPADQAIAAFAGLYELWRDPARSTDDPPRLLESVAIVTGAAQGALAAIHDRRPVILAPELWDEWLDPNVTDRERVVDLLRQYPAELVARRVSTRVNRVGEDGPHLVEPVEGDVDSPLDPA